MGRRIIGVIKFVSDILVVGAGAVCSVCGMIFAFNDVSAISGVAENDSSSTESNGEGE